MREIKFRAWVPSMYFPQKPEAHYVYNWQDSEWCKTVGFNCEKFIIEQYTGLKDKNGVEIYEGDILKRTEHINAYTYSAKFPLAQDTGEMTVVVTDGAVTLNPEARCGQTMITTRDSGECEIIGNIHLDK